MLGHSDVGQAEHIISSTAESLPAKELAEGDDDAFQVHGVPKCDGGDDQLSPLAR